MYRFWADVVVVIHALYASFVVLGLGAILLGVALRWRWVRNFWFRIVHLAMIGIVVLESLVGMICPLTSLEDNLRQQAGGEAVYAGSFIGHWVHEALFVDVPAWVLNACYYAFGLAVLATLILAPPQWPWKKKARSTKSEIPNKSKAPSTNA